MKKIILCRTLATVIMAVSFLLTNAEFYSPQVIKIYDEEELADMEDSGVQILRRRGDILLCLVPTDNDTEIVIPNSHRKAARPGPRTKADFRDFSSGFNTPTLDKAISHYDADDIISGFEFPEPYTGKGVVVGICDIGFDPLHPTFLDSEGHSRVKRVTQYIEREGIRIVMEGDEQYAEWKTDDPLNYHATHVCGILAGGGGGTPYAGIARDADIVVSTSTLSDVGLLAGVEDIIDYAKEVGKPAVINLSMGNYTGPHDGTSLFSQYLDLCADDAIFVLSAGNEGTHTNYLPFTFTEDKRSVGFRLGNKSWNQIEMYGMTDIWNSSSSPLTVEISIFDDYTHEIIHTYPPFTITDRDDVKTLTWTPSDPVVEGCGLDGFMMITGGTDPENGRHRTMLLYDYDSATLVPSKKWARYLIAVNVVGKPGDCAEVYADGSFTRLMKLSGNPSPTTDMSISDLACGHRVICAGMYANRKTAPVSVRNNLTWRWEEKEHDWGYEEMNTVEYSSYGTLRDGRQLPHTVAPGMPLVSALSSHYLKARPQTECLRLDASWIADGGTSMASPFVAGFIATWLEANPSLTAEMARDLIMATNNHDISDPEDPRNVNGWFNPKAALRKMIDDSGIDDIKNDPREINPEDHIMIFNISGVKVYEGKYGEMPALPNGVYIVSVAGDWIFKTARRMRAMTSSLGINSVMSNM